MLTTSFPESIKEYFISKWPEEACGYLKYGVFYPLENCSEDKENDIEVDGEFLIRKPDVFVHSHTFREEPPSDPRAPSEVDLHNQIITNIEWAICATDGKTCSDPIFWGNPNHRPPIEGREFIVNAQDCLSLVQDWYYEHLNIRLPNKARSADWDLGYSFMDDEYTNWGFYDVPLDDLKHGDVMMMRVLLATTTNHLAVYVGDGKIIHHGYGQVPITEQCHRWLKRTVRVVRHKDVK
jgi:hypothetical protein